MQLFSTTGKFIKKRYNHRGPSPPDSSIMTFLPKKIYLNGSDCFHLMLEKSRELTREGNNQFYLCVQLQTREALETIEQTVQQSPLLDWIANIRLINPQIGVPFFRYMNQGNTLTVRHHENFTEQFPAQLLNDTLSLKNNSFFRIDAYSFNGKQYLLLTFHHVLFDGKGAGMMLQHLTGQLPVDNTTFSSLFPQQLKWKNPLRQWQNLIRVKKQVEQTNKAETAYLEAKNNRETGFGMTSHLFSEEETAFIRENAIKNGVRFGLNFFQVACIAKAFRTVLTETDSQWVPIPYNGRKRGVPGAIISNHTSFIFHRLNVTPETSLREIAVQLQQQMNEQLKCGLPEKYNDLLQLMRFFPAWFNHLVTTQSSKGKIASFLYSSTEAGEKENTELVKQQWILPPFSYPPGFTVNFYTYHNRLNFHIVFSRKHVDSEQINTFKTTLIHLLTQK